MRNYGFHLDLTRFEPKVPDPVPLDRDPRRLDAAVDSLEARDVEGNLGSALALASDRLRQLPGEKHLVVITDGALAHPDALGSATSYYQAHVALSQFLAAHPGERDTIQVVAAHEAVMMT